MAAIIARPATPETGVAGRVPKPRRSRRVTASPARLTERPRRRTAGRTDHAARFFRRCAAAARSSGVG
ncbi:hypothetical protein, partial [Streptomyces anulatus]|uniref:hypothetical protein n=1 Tax=Streptomyces anulatus TaxID=1892 RepID=UPI001941FED2